MRPFEDDLIKMIENIKFRNSNDRFQTKLRSDIQKVNASDKVLVFAEKTRNVYQMEKDEYEKLLRENITKTYKKANENTADLINTEFNSFNTDLDISDRVETMAKHQAFITIKDHKDNFENSRLCRLINPTKSDLGKVCKQILENINNRLSLPLKPFLSTFGN